MRCFCFYCKPSSGSIKLRCENLRKCCGAASNTKNILSRTYFFYCANKSSYNVLVCSELTSTLPSSDSCSQYPQEQWRSYSQIIGITDLVSRIMNHYSQHMMQVICWLNKITREINQTKFSENCHTKRYCVDFYRNY